MASYMYVGSGKVLNFSLLLITDHFNKCRLPHAVMHISPTHHLSSNKKSMETTRVKIRSHVLVEHDVSVNVVRILNLNSLLVKRQIYNPSPGAVTGGN